MKAAQNPFGRLTRRAPGSESIPSLLKHLFLKGKSRKTQGEMWFSRAKTPHSCVKLTREISFCIARPESMDCFARSMPSLKSLSRPAATNAAEALRREPVLFRCYLETFHCLFFQMGYGCGSADTYLVKGPLTEYDERFLGPELAENMGHFLGELR